MIIVICPTPSLSLFLGRGIAETSSPVLPPDVSVQRVGIQHSMQTVVRETSISKAWEIEIQFYVVEKVGILMCCDGMARYFRQEWNWV